VRVERPRAYGRLSNLNQLINILNLDSLELLWCQSLLLVLRQMPNSIPWQYRWFTYPRCHLRPPESDVLVTKREANEIGCDLTLLDEALWVVIYQIAYIKGHIFHRESSHSQPKMLAQILKEKEWIICWYRPFKAHRPPRAIGQLETSAWMRVWLFLSDNRKSIVTLDNL
jgi:hypothetical protein